jgi:hypothetical protein
MRKMGDHSDEMLRAVSELRDLVRLMAEPALAARDQKLRSELRRVVGRSATKVKAVLLMDGSRPQRVIHRESGLNEGHLSTLVKQLKVSNLLQGDGKEPKLAIAIPANFFESGKSNE